MCYKCLACESKVTFILILIVGSSVGCRLNCPLIPYLKVVGCPLSCPLSCPLYQCMEKVGSLICMAKFPWEAHSPLSCPLSPYMKVVGSIICMAKVPRAAHSVAHGQRSWQLPCFFCMDGQDFFGGKHKASMCHICISCDKAFYCLYKVF